MPGIKEARSMQSTGSFKIEIWGQDLGPEKCTSIDREFALQVVEQG